MSILTGDNPFGEYKKSIEEKNTKDASKGDEEKFHQELDKLVHKTFGKSEDEKKED